MEDIINKGDMMNNIGTQKVITDRLTLRCFTLDDAESMYENWAKDSEVTKYLRWLPHENIKATKSLLSQWIESYHDLSYYSWAIVLKESNTVIGSIGIMKVSEIDQTGEIGYCIGKNWWGKGIMTEALKAVLQFCFNDVGFNRLESDHSVNNPASGRVMQKAGMLFEGIARQKYKSNLGFQDCKLYSILKDDYIK